MHLTVARYVQLGAPREKLPFLLEEIDPPQIDGIGQQFVRRQLSGVFRVDGILAEPMQFVRDRFTLPALSLLMTFRRLKSTKLKRDGGRNDTSPRAEKAPAGACSRSTMP